MTEINTPTASELKSRAIDLSKDAGKTLGAQINEVGDHGLSVAGQKLDQVADYIAEKGEEVVEQERLPVKAEHVETTTGGIRNAANYLTQSDPVKIVQDTESAMRAHPYRTLAVGLCAGWLAGKLMSR